MQGSCVRLPILRPVDGFYCYNTKLFKGDHQRNKRIFCYVQTGYDRIGRRDVSKTQHGQAISGLLDLVKSVLSDLFHVQQADLHIQQRSLQVFTFRCCIDRDESDPRYLDLSVHGKQQPSCDSWFGCDVREAPGQELNKATGEDGASSAYHFGLPEVLRILWCPCAFLE